MADLLTGISDDPEELRRRMALANAAQGDTSGVGVPPPDRMPLPSAAAASPAPAAPAAPATKMPPLRMERPTLGFSPGENRISQHHPFWGGLLKGMDVAGSIVAPGVMSEIPGTMQHEKAKVAAGNQVTKGNVGLEKEQAETEEAQARAKSLENPPAKQGLTPEETTIHDLMTGDNGNPRINPDTQKPYSYLEAYEAIKNVGAQTKHVPVGDAAAKQFNDSILRELNVNPKTTQKKIPAEYEVKATDTDAEAKEKMQRAKDLVAGATGQQKIVVQEGQFGTSRTDKSYDRQAKRLDDARKPIDESVKRMGRLIDTLNQKNPQADALVGPELLSVMSGGAGSGLRMNEAEIARIVGGRSAWESLKAAIQHWNTNPEDARSITPEQDKQIRSLIETVHQKLIKKQQILDKASDDLLEAGDVATHRKIVTESQKALDAIDAGETTAGTGDQVIEYVRDPATKKLVPKKQ